MRSEFQYFMSAEDHSALDKLLNGIGGVELKSGENYDEILYLDGFIQYARSELIDGVLTGGRIAIASTDLDGTYNCESYIEVEKLYKKLRNWLKKRSTNKLLCFNEKIGRGTIMPVKNFWLCKGAEELVRANEVRLKQFNSTYAVFELA